MPNKPLLIIQMGEPPQPIAQAVGVQGDWFEAALAQQDVALRRVRPDRAEPLPSPETISGAVISGSWAMVTDRLAWSETTGAWLRSAFSAGLPLFGVCYGHQLMADALGGKVADNPNGKEVGLQTVTLAPQATDDALLQQFPPRFSAYLTHQQSVLAPPSGAQVLAHSAQDGCQIIRYGEHAFSVQFHPEFTADIMRSGLSHSAAALRAAGHDVDRLLQLGEEPLWARRILLNFVQRYALDRGRLSA